ncbi:hypothetical protein Cgig2_027811 [Carnegiea gigantea]|uniref:Alpha-1,3/1,6-mannosyltransferase ALG2 n=1 Tax=Carnegiea gigantea TaxID=171969 RepID=A0A9Q1QAF7_9CARY|nr:hypothetical protein Cgig2_027811 [Carnegiea gigantea]
MEKKESSKLKIAIVHPDLGIGGAERLVVDAAMELASHGHYVRIFTSHHDRNRCFEETLSDVVLYSCLATVLIDVTCLYDWNYRNGRSGSCKHQTPPFRPLPIPRLLRTGRKNGGYDRRLRENVEYLEELKLLAQKEGVSDQVEFITSCSTSERNTLLSQCLCVLYTPTDEHFGIVPLEAMAAYKPVIACNSGGPTETIKHEVTGYLCDPSPEEFSAAMLKTHSRTHISRKLGREARQHVIESFSTKVFGQHLNQYVLSVARLKSD